MPASDELLVHMIRSACKEKMALKRVAAIDIEPEKVLARFEDCMPAGLHVETAAFRVDPSEAPQWLSLESEPVVLSNSSKKQPVS
jgi:hypothetical protein